jgi:DNA-binding NarL/FixJ family response regulator
MNKKLVLNVEDDEALRLPLKGMLFDRGFDVRNAANVKQAREIAQEIGDLLDVVSLDMDLKDPRGISGGHVGLEILGSHPDYPPEFLVVSGEPDLAYYSLAIQLDVAAYLPKPISPEEHIRHIRALALRRGLSLARPKAAQRISRIASESRSLTDAVVHFCREILAPELESCLGAHFVILFNGERGTQVCATDTDLPDGPDPAYKQVQALALGEGNRSEPFVLKSSRLEAFDTHTSAEILRRLDKAAFIPLSVRDLRLSLGVLQTSPSNKLRYPEDPRALCKVLAQYLKPTVIDHMLTILTQWAELEAKRKTVLINTAQFCLSVGQEQLDILSMSNGGVGQPSQSVLQKLRTLAEDLRDTGGTLLHLGDEPVDGFEQMSMFLRDTWEEVAGPEAGFRGTFKVEGDCVIQADSDDLYIVTSRMLQWFRQRWDDLPEGGAPLVTARCTETDRGAEITFEDRSRRLSKRLREELFTPFTQAISLPMEIAKEKLPGRYLPFYLAQMLVEEKYKGHLEDRSDELPGETGHRFLMHFPAADHRCQNAVAAS